MNLIKNKLDFIATKISKELNEILPNHNEELYKAIRYSALPCGKCIRGFLVAEFCKLFDISYKISVKLACIVELIHTFSLIHDDLPALDNSDMRRGKLSCHKKFNESTAILTGDAILVLVYDLIGEYFPQLVSFFSKKIIEMINGQVYDLNNKIERNKINKMKTGAIFALSCSCGAKFSNIESDIVDILMNFGYNFGIFFQLIDDYHDNLSLYQKEIHEQLKILITILDDKKIGRASCRERVCLYV